MTHNNNISKDNQSSEIISQVITQSRKVSINIQGQMTTNHDTESALFCRMATSN